MKPICLMAVLLLSLATSRGSAEAPSAPLNLHCGSYLVLVSTSFMMKAENLMSDDDIDYVSYSIVALSKNSEAPLLSDTEQFDYGKAERERFILAPPLQNSEWRINRVSGELSLYTDGQLKGKYSCSQRSRDDLDTIIRMHNNKVRKNRPAVKF